MVIRSVVYSAFATLLGACSWVSEQPVSVPTDVQGIATELLQDQLFDASAARHDRSNSHDQAVPGWNTETIPQCEPVVLIRA